MPLPVPVHQRRLVARLEACAAELPLAPAQLSRELRELGRALHAAGLPARAERAEVLARAWSCQASLAGDRGLHLCLVCGASLAAHRAGTLTCTVRCRQALARGRRLSPSQRVARLAGCEPRDCWRTPPQLIQALEAELGPVALDAAATVVDSVAPSWIGPPTGDALQVPWGPRPGWVWCNPPYSRRAGGLLAWVNRAVHQAETWGLVVVLCVPPGIGSAYRQRLVSEAAEVRDLVGRVAFLNPDTGRPGTGNREGSTLALLRPGGAGGARVRSWDWRVP